MKHTHTHSRIERELPKSVISEINNMLCEGNATYDEIKDFLSGIPVILKEVEYKLPAGETYDISRSSIGRYGKRFFDVFKSFMQIQQQAKMMVSESEECLFMEEAVSRLSISKLFQLLINTELSPNQISAILTSISKIQSAAVEREKFKQSLTKKIKKARQSKGLSAEAIEVLDSILDGE